MMSTSNDRLRWIKIARVDSLGKILDVTDPDPLPQAFDPDEEGARTPKFALNYVEYDPRTTKSSLQYRHWVDEPDLYLIATDLLHSRRGDPDGDRFRPIHQEFKGGSAVAAGITTLGDNGLVSRQFSVSYNTALKIGPAYEFRFVVTEGEKGDKGQINPVQGSKPLLDIKPMYVKAATARKLGGQILSYLQAKKAAGLVGTYHIEPLIRMIADLRGK